MCIMSLYSLLEALNTIDDRRSLIERRFVEEEDDTTNLTGDLEKDFEIVQNKLKSASSYGGFIEELKDILGDPKLYALLKDGFGTVDPIKVSYKEENIPAQNLHPTQKEIDLSKSLIYPLVGGENGEDEASVAVNINRAFTNGAMIKAPIVTFNGKYVIDGHHRWSTMYCVNPKVAVKCINFTYADEDNPIDVLKLFQTSIGIANKSIPSAEAKPGLNIYQLSDKEIAKWVSEHITDACVRELGKKVPTVTDTESAVKYFVSTTNSLKKNNGPASGSPARNLMPQTSTGSMDVIKAGQSDVA